VFKISTGAARGAAVAVVLSVVILGAACDLARGATASLPLAAQEQPADTETAYVGMLLLAMQGESGYAGEWLDEDARTLTIYSTQGPSAAIQEILGKKPEGFRVSWAHASHSLSELSSAARQVWEAGVGAQLIEYAPDGSGITVSYSVEDQGNDSADAPDRLQRLADLDRLITWVPVEEDPVQPADTRTTDTSPFDGGSRIASVDGGCSAGFSAERTNGNRGMVTAWHCSEGETGVTWKVSGSGATIGTSAASSKGWDAQFVRGAAGVSFTNKIFWGSYTTGSKISLPGGYFVVPFAIGSNVTVSGGYSGNQAGKITGLAEGHYLSGTAQNGKKYYEVTANGGHPLGGNGDSGSPVVHVEDGLATPVGIYVALYTNSAYVVPCQGVPASSTRKCSTVGLVSPWYRIIDALDLS